MDNDTLQRIKIANDLDDSMTVSQHTTVNDACERVRMGKSGYWHELAQLVIERDGLIAYIEDEMKDK